MVEHEFAVGAGRAEAGVAAGGLDFLALLEQGSCPLLAEEFLGLVGGKERQDIVDALDAFFQCGDELFGLGLFIRLADRSEVILGDVFEASIGARRVDDTLYMLQYFFFRHDDHPF